MQLLEQLKRHNPALAAQLSSKGFGQGAERMDHAKITVLNDDDDEVKELKAGSSSRHNKSSPFGQDVTRLGLYAQNTPNASVEVKEKPSKASKSQVKSQERQ